MEFATDALGDLLGVLAGIIEDIAKNRPGLPDGIALHFAAITGNLPRVHERRPPQASIQFSNSAISGQCLSKLQ